MPETKEPESALVDGQLYLGDNGRVFCGRLQCAGLTARTTGRDLSGQPVEYLSIASAVYLEQNGVKPECESCGQKYRKPTLDLVTGTPCKLCHLAWSDVDASGFCAACRLGTRVRS